MKKFAIYVKSRGYDFFDIRYENVTWYEILESGTLLLYGENGKQFGLNKDAWVEFQKIPRQD